LAVKLIQIINPYFVKSCARIINPRGPLFLLAIVIVTVFCGGAQRTAAKPAASVVLTDILPVETTIVSCNSSNGACGASGNNLTLTFPSIAYGVPMNVSVFVKVNDNVPAGTIITNTATITSSTPDPDLSDNTSTTSVVFPPQP
jgi:hypothetical protein